MPLVRLRNHLKLWNIIEDYGLKLVFSLLWNVIGRSLDLQSDRPVLYHSDCGGVLEYNI
ncbi:hypothetical protein HanIR_Chr02g0071821 [Helianthus annuus]|nr:hypothetical protein HanIR_Chr02g0071821 [Helianthus annuus]